MCTAYSALSRTFALTGGGGPALKDALQLLISRYGETCFAHVHERVSTESFVVLILGNSESNHLNAQGTFNAAIGSRRRFPPPST